MNTQELAWMAGVSERIARRWMGSASLSIRLLVKEYTLRFGKMTHSMVVPTGKCGRRNLFYWRKGELYIHWRGRKYWIKEVGDVLCINGEIIIGSWNNIERGCVIKYR